MSTNSSQLVVKEHKAGAGTLQKYLFNHMTPLNPHLQKLREASLQDDRAVMLGAADEMNFLQLLLATIGARKTLDIGVFTGYSALAVALVLPPDGRVVACDVTDHWVNKYGRAVWREAGVEDKIDLRIAPATETLEGLLAAGEAGSYDFSFIDADKENYPQYYELSLKLLRPGGIIAVDNALWSGRVLEEDLSKMDRDTRAIHQVNENAARDPRVQASLLNVGDGVMLCRKL